MSKLSKKDEIVKVQSVKPIHLIIKYIAIIIAVFLVLNIFFINAKVPTASMEDTISIGDRLLGLRVFGRVNRGDIVVFPSPLDGRYLVKRVVAVGGDTVECSDGVLIVNGQAEDGDYVVGKTEWSALSDSQIVVPDGELLLLGDNRENSIDCRFFDYPFIKCSSVVAKLGLRYYPLSKFGMIN